MSYAEIAAFAGRHPQLSIALIAITLALIGVEIALRLGGIRRIGPAVLVAMMNRENALVVDLRSPGDFEKGHIAGAKNVQLSQFDPENKQLAPAKALPVVLVCQSGQTAQGAASRMRKAGFTQVSVLDGGVQAWRGADLPLVKGR
ncbi:rhodanese-like domain-containing protein [Thermomonas sp.]|uniref:rhodanese-like domain-containing protein n=1 Tax=Thermomonas sp. TaxID=1971895 RepID=UPI001D897AE4|nr:rhodanese-like domain-containing protein [Thermomonas sp.]MBZ0086763.1 rhodanese-like domain-containing protein [Thermomonas sp.]MCO5055540.1 rhodanese-like domain-containing protein [Thermomonas sp.]HRO64101.1 rhodanese-like domain-containing protein [Thermomonas sp.]